MKPETSPPQTQAAASPGPAPLSPNQHSDSQPGELDRSTRVLLIVTVMALAGIALFLMAIIVPKFSRVFSDMLDPGTPLPLLTNVVVSHMAAIIGAVAALASVVTAILARTHRRTTLVTMSLIAIILLVGLITLIPFALMQPMKQIIFEAQK